MSSTSEQAHGSRRTSQPTTHTDGHGTGPYTEYEPYTSTYTEGVSSLGGWLLVLGGLFSFFAGLAMVVRSAYFTALPSYAGVSHYYAYHWNVSGWGWASLILGVVVVAVGIFVLVGQAWARWAGAGLAVISGLGSFLLIPIFPVWSIIVIAVDVFIVWALMTTGKRRVA